MLFDLFSIAKVSIKIEYPNKILLFIENLCFCSLKIAVCALKTPIGRKKLKIPIRLKITEWSKNLWSKNPRARAYVCACMRVCMIVRTPPDTPPQDTRQEHTPPEHRTPEDERKTRGKRNTSKAGNLPIYRCNCRR